MTSIARTLMKTYQQRKLLRFGAAYGVGPATLARMAGCVPGASCSHRLLPVPIPPWQATEGYGLDAPGGYDDLLAAMTAKSWATERDGEHVTYFIGGLGARDGDLGPAGEVSVHIDAVDARRAYFSVRCRAYFSVRCRRFFGGTTSDINAPAGATSADILWCRTFFLRAAAKIIGMLPFAVDGDADAGWQICHALRGSVDLVRWRPGGCAWFDGVETAEAVHAETSRITAGWRKAVVAANEKIDKAAGWREPDGRACPPGHPGSGCAWLPEKRLHSRRA